MSPARLSKMAGSLSRRLPHGWRRFLLDRLGLSAVAGLLSKNATASRQLTNGMSICFNPILHSSMFKDGTLDYEIDVLKFISEHIGDGDVCYDIGANIGLYTLIAADLAGDNGHVYAFEPERNNLRCLETSIQENGCSNVTIVPCAAGAADGSARFDRRGGAFSGRLLNSHSRGPARRVVDVQVRSLDSCLLQSSFRPPTIIKIDVEGGEGDVLAGARRLLDTCAPILIIEMHRRERETSNNVGHILAEAHYRVFTLPDFVRNGTSAPVAVSPLSGHVVALPAGKK